MVVVIVKLDNYWTRNMTYGHNRPKSEVVVLYGGGWSNVLRFELLEAQLSWSIHQTEIPDKEVIGDSTIQSLIIIMQLIVDK
jgi:hypothetical protein